MYVWMYFFLTRGVRARIDVVNRNTLSWRRIANGDNVGGASFYHRHHNKETRHPPHRCYCPSNHDVLLRRLSCMLFILLLPCAIGTDTIVRLYAGSAISCFYFSRYLNVMPPTWILMSISCKEQNILTTHYSYSFKIFQPIKLIHGKENPNNVFFRFKIIFPFISCLYFDLFTKHNQNYLVFIYSFIQS